MITSTSWRGKRYAVLGLARSGRATVEALLASGAEVVAWDSDPARRHPSESWDPIWLKRASAAGDPSFRWSDACEEDLTGFTAVVVSPGVPLNRHPIAGHAAKYGVPVIGDIELFAQARAELPPHKVVGITGTNGKSTTTALVHHILKTAGVPTTMGGNIGLPILGQEPLTPHDKGVGVYVLELSSYQIDLTFTLDCEVAVLLNITPDHLDRYDGFEGYAAAKEKLLEMQSSSQAIVFGSAFHSQRRAVYDRYSNAGKKVLCAPNYIMQDPADLWDPFDSAHWFSVQKDWPSLQGPHNAENAGAALNVCGTLGLSNADIARGLETYPGLPHRMERIREVNGVLFVNDSKATNADSAAPALAAYPHVRWILGGQAKTAELDACATHFGHVRSAYTIGEAGGMFAELLRPHMPVEEAGTLAVAVEHAARDAFAGDTVLLSPACASFDQFKNFEDRGDAFRQLVEAR